MNKDQFIDKLDRFIDKKNVFIYFEGCLLSNNSLRPQEENEVEPLPMVNIAEFKKLVEIVAVALDSNNKLKTKKHQKRLKHF